MKGEYRMFKNNVFKVSVDTKQWMKKAGVRAVKTMAQTFVATVGESLNAGDKVALVGFGTFSVSERSERTGRNPQTGKTITIPAKKVVKFKAGAELAEKC